MPRFVLLYHDCPGDKPRPSHCDLMLEANGALRTWAIHALPRSWHAAAGSPNDFGMARPGASSDGRSVPLASTNTVDAEQLPDHRLAYLDYEGPVSDGRGTVVQLDAGTYKALEESPDTWIVELSGRLIRGRVTLHRDQLSIV